MWLKSLKTSQKSNLGTVLVLLVLLVITNCHRSSQEMIVPVSARNLAEEYEHSSTAVRTQYDGKEITVRGYAGVAAVMPQVGSDQGSIQLADRELQSDRRVVCWFSKEQREIFSQVKGAQYITVRGVFNGESGVDLKFCKLVGVE